MKWKVNKKETNGCEMVTRFGASDVLKVTAATAAAQQRGEKERDNGNDRGVTGLVGGDGGIGGEAVVGKASSGSFLSVWRRLMVIQAPKV